MEIPPASHSSPQGEFDPESLHADDLSGQPSAPAASGVPFWLVILSSVVAFWGGGYLLSNSSGFKSDIYNEVDSKPWLAGPGDADSAAEVVKDAKYYLALGEKTFKQNCVACHQSSGLGVAGQYPPLVKSEWVISGNKRPILILLYGLHGPVTVEGAVYNGNMPAWGVSLNDEKIAAVLTYVRQSWGNAASPIATEQVAAMRKEHGQHAQWLAEELEKIPHEEDVPAPAAAPPAAQNLLPSSLQVAGK